MITNKHLPVPLLLGAFALTACETYPAPHDEDQYLEAIAVVEDADLPVEIVETFRPLPLPGQMKEIPAPSFAPSSAPSL